MTVPDAHVIVIQRPWGTFVSATRHAPARLGLPLPVQRRELFGGNARRYQRGPATTTARPLIAKPITPNTLPATTARRPQ